MSTSMLKQTTRNASTALLLTPTTLVCVGRGKLTSFVRYLEESLGIENCLVDREVLQRSTEQFFYLDLAQVARMSQEAVHWLKGRRCSIVTGCRIGGFDALRFSGLLVVLLMRYKGTAWDNQRYAVLAASASTIEDILSRCDLACMLQQELFDASFDAGALQSWPAMAEKREQDREFLLEMGVQPLPLSWSRDGQEVMCGLLDYVPANTHTRQKVLLAGDLTGKGVLRHVLDLGILRTAFFSAWKRLAGEDLTTCSVSPAGDLLALVFASKTVLFNKDTQQVVRVLPVAGNPVCWSPDGTKVALCLTMHYDPGKTLAENQVEVWDVGSRRLQPWLVYDGHHVEHNEHNEHLRSANWSVDGRLIVTAGSTTGMSATAHVWDATTGALRLEYGGHRERVTTAVFAPVSSTDPLIATAGDDHTIQVWHALTGECVFHACGNSASFRKGWLHEHHVAWSLDGMHIAFQTARDELALAHVATGQVKLVCALAPYALLDVAWSPDGKHIATVEVNFTADEEEPLYSLCIRPAEESPRVSGV